MSETTFEPTMKVRLKLAEILEERDIGQRELSRITGIRHASIHEMCQNKTIRLPLDNLAAICEVLNVDISDIIELVPKDEENT